jgi:hypothetical protein
LPAPKRVADQQQAPVRRELAGGVESPGRPEREGPVAGGDRLRERAGGENLVLGGEGERRAVIARRLLGRARPVGGAGADVGGEGRSLVERRGRGSGRGEQGAGGEPELTCWDN